MDRSELGEENGRRITGPISWMARNSVATNLLMLSLIAGGLLMATRVKQEVFPEFSLDVISVAVPYPGATPEEVEQGVLLAVEEAVQGIDGVKKVTSTAVENVGQVSVEVLSSADPDEVLSDVKNEVDRITSFPEDAEEPTVSQIAPRNQAISVIVHGDLSDETLRQYAERVRRELIALDDIILVELSGVPSREISIEVPRATLRAYNLSLDQVAHAVRAGSIELTGGAVRTAGGEVLVRTSERRDLGTEFEDITVLTTSSGGHVRLGDIAEVRDAFQQTDQEATYDGEPAVKIDVYRVGDQTPNQVAGAAKAYVERFRSQLPDGVGIDTWDDRSEIFVDRINLLVRNGIVGLILVFFVLGAFLELRLAFWVMLGIPISFLGAFLLFPVFGVSINMLSLFAFIVCLGIVVDDAIVVGENVYYKRQQGMKLLPAAIEGARQVGTPVVFAVLTSVAAFSPMLFVPGFIGNFFRVIPIIVISVLMLSLIESLFILPAHLGHTSRESPDGFWATIRRPQKRISDWLDRFVQDTYSRHVRSAVHFRYLTIAVAVATLLAAFGLVAGGRVPFVFHPTIEADFIVLQARLPVGASIDDARRVRDSVTASARKVIGEHAGIGGGSGRNTSILRGLYSQIGSPITGFGPQTGGPGAIGAHIIDIQLWLVAPDMREARTAVVAGAWRGDIGMPTGVQTVTFLYSTGPGSGPALNVQLMHTDTELLEEAATDLAAAMSRYEGVTDVDAGFANGKPQLDLTLRPAARALGLTESSMARQIRSALFGAEALRQQRGRDEVRVMVRLPEEDREHLYGLEQFRLRTPSGSELPLEQAATISEARAHTKVTRVDGGRVLSVTADVDEGAVPDLILSQVEQSDLPAVMERYPGLRYSFEGEQADQRESMAALQLGFMGALLVIYALLAIPFRSYIQPIIVMSAIPFGFIGAIGGHLLLGYNMSVVSMMGLVALAGVVVNDSLVLIVAVNDLREQGKTAYEAVVEGGMRRFRPILLTSLTTFFGLAPLIFETSMQARFLIPMALSLGFGILFATGIVLMLVPALYIAVEDARGMLAGGQRPDDEERDALERGETPVSTIPA